MFIDIILLVLMALAIIKGFRKGLIVAAFSFVGIVIGLAAAMKLSAWVAAALKTHTSIGAGWLPFLAFVLILVLVWALVRAGAALIEASVEMAFLGWLNTLGGILMYASLYAIVYSILLFYTDKLHLLTLTAINSSKTYTYLAPIGPKTMEIFSKSFIFFSSFYLFYSDLSSIIYNFFLYS
jgi:membrane protein required for colicin V production